MSVSAWVALYKLITAPHHWSKTKHGLHLNKKAIIDQVNDAIGKCLVDINNTNPSLASNRISGLSIILPAYNEEENISTMTYKVDLFMKRLKIDYEIIIVNDGSNDKTKELIDNLVLQNKRIKAIHHKINCGYGAALKSGFDAADKDWIFFTDSDLQFDITEITKLLEKVEDAQLIVGYRKKRQDPLLRIFNANLYKISLKLLFGLNIKDVDCAFKLFSREVIVKNPLKANGTLINAELLIKAKRRKYKTIQVGVSHYPRTKGYTSGVNPKVILLAMKELIAFRFANTL